MNIELKPCPFCGGEAEARLSPNSRSEEGARFYEVRCKNCGVRVIGESFNFWIVKYNKEKPQDLLSAVEAWNKRAYEENGRKTGKWIHAIPLPGEADSYKHKLYWKCSVCGGRDFFNPQYSEKIKFCRHCGAKMEVDE